MRSGIILAGTSVLDIVHMIERWPDEEQIAFIRNTIHAPGGPPHNAAAGLVKLGASFPVTMICLVGDDAAGDTFIAKAAEHGLDTRHIVRVPGVPTDCTLVMTSMATGRRTFFVLPGVNATMTPEQVMPPHDRAKIFYIGSPVISVSMDQCDGWRTVLRAARAQGYKTAMELCPVPAEVQRERTRPCLPLLDYFVINDSEAEAVSGVAVTRDGRLDRKAAENACRALLDLGVNDLACVHHPDGAVAVRRDGECLFAASVKVPQAEVVGTVGAGDAFYAGMLYGLHEDWSLDRCLALANASAATSLHSATTSSSIRPWAECLAYAASRGLRE